MGKRVTKTALGDQFSVLQCPAIKQFEEHVTEQVRVVAVVEPEGDLVKIGQKLNRSRRVGREAGPL